MSRKLETNKAVKWFSEEITNVQNMSSSFHYYKKFQFKKIVGEIGEFVLISNADAADPDTEAGCDAARIVLLYEDSANSKDPFRAKVQWYSRPGDLPPSCFNNMESVEFLENEVLEDHRPFNADISIETIFKKCSISFCFTRDTDSKIRAPFNYICRYRVIAVSKKKLQIEPVLEEERSALTLLCTPVKSTRDRTPRTPNSLTKNMSRMSLSEPRNWSISKNEGSKLLLKRAVLADKDLKNSPKKVTPKSKPNMKPTNTPESTRNLNTNDIEEILSMELQERSDEDMPILLIRKHIATTPKRKSIVPSLTPQKVLESDKEVYITKSGRKVRSPASYSELQSPVMRTPTKISTRKSLNYLQDNSPVTKTPQKLIRKAKGDKKIKDILSMELQENSDEEIPTLIIRQQETSPTRKTETGAYTKTPTKVSVFENDEKESSSRSRRVTRGDVNNYKQEETPGKNTPTRRSTRKTINYREESPVKKTPQKVIRELNYDSDDDFQRTPKTPKTPKTKTPRTPRSSSVKTPQRGRRIIVSQLTPALHARAHSVDNIKEFLNEDKSLPGRETELKQILCFVRSKLHSGTSGCMYISGLPGTGKTATVNSALNILKEEADLPDFNLVEVNGMKITEPRQAYVHIYKQLTGKTVAWEQACKLLTTRFTAASPRRVPTVLIVDELDALCKRKQDVVYCIMDWAKQDPALLTVLAVANTMDLPERVLTTRVASRLGLTRVYFQPYTHAQLQRIVALRLAGGALGLTADAMQLIARKVAAVSGDARRALSLCSRALEHAAAERAGAGQGVAGLRHVQAGAGQEAAGLRHVQAALDEAASGAIVRVIQHCSPAERLLLRAMAAEVERTGTDETTLPRVLATAGDLMALEGRPYRCATSNRTLTPSQAHTILMRLWDMRLVIMEPKPTGAKLMLNVSVDDIYYATKPIIL